MLRFMLDTNICIYVIKNRPAELRERFNAYAEQLSISTVTLAELYYGAEKSARQAENLGKIEWFAAQLEVLPFDDAAAGHFGEIRAGLEQSGKVIGSYDMMIGAHARSASLTLVTNNMREFERIPGLRVENWV